MQEDKENHVGFKNEKEIKITYQAWENLIGLIFLCGLWDQSHYEINTPHSHLLHSLIYCTSYSLKAMVFPPFLGGWGQSCKTQKKTNKSAQCNAIGVIGGQHPRGAKTSPLIYCPLTPLSLCPHATLGWSGLSHPLHTEWPDAVLHLQESFKIFTQMPSSAHGYWTWHSVCQRTHTGL